VSYPSTAADVRKDGRIAKAIARQCATSRTAGSLPYMTTANTARDMDRIREALGERKISYLGASYGTYLGAVYTTLFPQRSDRFVLDSSLGPGGYDYTAQRRFGHGLEERFPDFAKFAAANPQYGLGSTPKQIRATFFDLARRLEKTPVQGIDGSRFRGLTFESLYSNVGMPALAKQWKALDTNQPPPGNVHDTTSPAQPKPADERAGRTPASHDRSRRLIVTSALLILTRTQAWIMKDGSAGTRRRRQEQISARHPCG
jgi:pimeloyl-ACP methyl ester carboxylesterase